MHPAQLEELLARTLSAQFAEVDASVLQGFVRQMEHTLTQTGLDSETAFAKLWRDFLVEYREDFRFLLEAEAEESR